MKKFIYCLNITLLVLIPTIILTSAKDNNMKHKTDTTALTKMISTTILLDRSNKKIQEEELAKQEEEKQKEQEKEEIKKLEQIEEKKREVAAKKIVPVKVEEVVSSRATGETVNTEQPQTTNVVANSDKRVFVGAKFYDRKISSYGTDCCKTNNYTEEEKLNNWDLLGLGLTASGYQLQYRNIYFNAGSYGNIRIVAADHAGQLDFPLTTIVKITEKMDDGSYDSFNAIVLDRGDKNIGLDSKYIFDLVSENMEAAKKFGVHADIEVEVLKLGTSETLSMVRRYGHL